MLLETMLTQEGLKKKATCPTADRKEKDKKVRGCPGFSPPDRRL